jgi:hypothetical protein
MVPVVLLLGVAFAGCDRIPFYTAEVKFTLDNRADAAVCYYASPEDASGAACGRYVEPRSEAAWDPDCGEGYKSDVDSSPISVIITVKETGRQIYERTATCGEWNDTDRRFVIEQEGDEFIVTDSLPDE